MSDIKTKTKYDHKPVESKWNEEWYKNNIYEAVDFSPKPKKYILAEFPYPSGSKLHVGHAMRFTAPDILARKLRMSGYNVLYPFGWDAFGLPAENNAVKTGIHPAVSTKEAIETYKSQIRLMGYGVDWNREISTIDPEYYKWTQWLFLKFFENGLAELKEEPVWWCEGLKTVLANEEVITDSEGNLVAERDGKSIVEKRLLKQWVLKIPQYADKLIEGLSKTDFPDYVKNAQINWIGRSEGINIVYPIEGQNKSITVFTTRPDTNFGATFVVVAPDSKFVDENIENFPERENCEKYVETTKKKTELERISDGKKKTGAFTGWYAVNNLNGKKMPIYLSDFVLGNVGTGCVVGVPGHDIRDFQFAKAMGIEIIRVVVGSDGDESPITDEKQVQEEEGRMINSDFLNGMDIHDATKAIMNYIESKGWGKRVVNYKLRDWLFSRQRYWGEPIPLIHKQDGSVEAICSTENTEEYNKVLPLVLPEVPDYTPSSDASSPLSKNEAWVNTTAKDGTTAKRETNTMPNWAGSCWYYIRYIDPKNNEAFADMDKMKYWLPVDKYFGGSEHTTLHLLYSRFWHKFFYDLGLVPTEEPYQWRMNGGLLLGPDGQKMSKSIGNVLNPNEKIDLYGADALRLYISFMGPYDGTIIWQEGGLKACRKLVEEIIDLRSKVTQLNVIPAGAERSAGISPSAELTTAFHKMLKKVGQMIDDLKTNTAVSEFMIFVNSAKKEESINIEIWKGFLKALAPFAPFITEELWQEINGYTEFKKENSIHLQEWPKYDENLVKEQTITVGVQINGKLRAEVEVNIEENESTVKDRVLALPAVQKWLEGAQIKKFIYIPGKIVNIVA